MLEILFTLAEVIYFHFESLCQQFTFTRTAGGKKYHSWRIGENLGIIIAVHILLIIVKRLDLLPLFWLSTSMGLAWYEIFWNHNMYGSIWHQKEGYWDAKFLIFNIKIRHPKGWFWVALFITCLIVRILIIF